MARWMSARRLRARREDNERIFQERAKVARSTALNGETQTVVCTAILCDQRMVGVVQVEIPG